MAKKVKYEIYINTCNMNGNVFPITKKVFTDTLNNYQKQIQENNVNEEEEEYKLDEIDIKTTEYPQYKETLYAIYDNETAICLRKLECKPGYSWK